MKVLILVLLQGYRRFVSPLFPPSCRFTPTCSQYAIDAVTNFGAMKGLWMTLLRLLRCHPWHAGGYDPVVRHDIVEQGRV